MNTSTFENYESEVRSYCRHFPKVFTNAKGAVITDEDGVDYIDFFCGAGAVNYGHNNEYIKQKMVEYLSTDGIIHALDMYTVPKREFIETLEHKLIEPRGFTYKIQFCGPTGTNAVEAAIKLARKNKGRRNVFAFMGCFHGMTLGALSLTSEMYARGGAGASLNDVTHIPAPYMFEGLDVIQYMQTLIDDDHSGVEKPAAVIMETLQAEGGIRPFSDEFLRQVRDFCDKNDILMIVDDIQVGCCRCGSFFSFERAGIEPDMVVMSKSIGGLGMPLVASVIFFVLYYVVGMISEKSVRESAMGPIGMWVSTFVFIPIGAILTWQATTDSKLFDLATWKRWLHFKSRRTDPPTPPEQS